MNHKRYKEWLQLSVAGELAQKDMARLDEHLDRCDECRKEYAELRQLVTLVSEGGFREPSRHMLKEARQALRHAMGRESSLPGASRLAVTVSRVLGAGVATGAPATATSVWTDWFRGWRLALPAAAAIAVGFFVGYLAFARDVTAPVVTDSYDAGQIDQALGGPDIANVRFVDWNTRDGQIEIAYDMVRPVRLRASVGDSRMQRVLAHALLTEDNPGVRLRAIEALDVRTTGVVDEEVKLALIDALKTDPNAGVRSQSLRALQNLPFDQDIRDASLYVLANDDNPGMRVAAINSLSTATLAGHHMGKDVYELLRATLQTKDDPLLRARSRAFIEEVEE